MKDGVFFLSSIIILLAIMLFASILQTCTGFGLAIVATPFLLLIFEPTEAIQINLIVSIAISTGMIVNIKENIDFGILKRFSIGSLVGLPFGIIVLMFISLKALKLGIGIVIVLLTILL